MTLRLSGGRRLQSPPGATARPTAARVRQAVMNLLAAELRGAAWLDLFSGSGVMACEALQQGARRVVAVEQDRRIAAVARHNLALVQAGCASPAGSGRKPEVACHTGEVIRWLGRGCPGEPFTFVYADPPYAAGLYGQLAAAVARGGWLAGGGCLLFECASANVPVIPGGWRERSRRRYGSTTLLLLERAPDSPGRVSGVENAAAAVLVPGGHEQTQQRHGDETEHDAAEQGFDHGNAGVGFRATIFPCPSPAPTPVSGPLWASCPA
jgi:16S rRNA (guanine(966)-N(2))-methyltransferase RsmD